MRKGGYQIVDFRGESLTSGKSANIKGVYEQISRSGGKRIVISGLNISSTLYEDFNAVFTKGTNKYTAVATMVNSNITIEVALGDDVTVTVA